LPERRGPLEPTSHRIFCTPQECGVERDPERTDSNIAAVDVRLSTEHSRRIDELDSAGLVASEALL
jgi:hypothetical protein